jgi:outer membrane receptor for ferrienterochelin and colicin
LLKKTALIVLFFGFFNALYAQVSPPDSSFKASVSVDSIQSKKKYQFISENGFDEKLLNLFSTRQSIPKEEIDNSIIRTWGDILSLRKGIAGLDYSNFGQPEILQMGGSGENTGIVTDGFQYINHAFRFPYISGLDLSWFPMENVEDIKIIEPGLAGIYNQDAPLGCLLTKSKEFNGEKVFSKALYQKAPYNFRRTQLELGKNFTSRGMIYLTAGFKGYDGYLVNNHLSSMHLSFSGKYILKENWNLRVDASRLDAKIGLAHTEDFSLRPITEFGGDWRINLKLVHKATESSLSNFRISYYNMKQRFNDPGFSVFREDVEEIINLGMEHEFFYRQKHNLKLKGNWTYDRLDERSSIDHTQKINLSIADLFQASPRVDFLFFIGMNKASRFDGRLSPMSGISYGINQNSKACFTLGSFWGFPSIRDLYLDSTNYTLSSSPGYKYTIEGKSDLKAQKSLVANLGYSLNKSNYKLGLNVRRSRLENSVQWENQSGLPYDGKWIPLNQDLNLYGAELDFLFNPRQNVKLFASYAFQKAEEVKSDLDKPFVPEHSLFCYLEYYKKLLKNEIQLSGRVENNLISSYYAREKEKDKQKDIDILNLRITFRFLDFTCYYVIENLNDKSYKTFLSYPAPGRTQWWGFSWQFFD